MRRGVPRWTPCLLFLLLIALAQAGCGGGGERGSEMIRLPAPAEGAPAAWWASRSEPVALFLALGAPGAPVDDWAAVARALSAQGVAVLVVPLPAPGDRDPTLWLAAGLNAALDRVPQAPLLLGGAEVGASAALNFAAHAAGVQGVLLVSPARDAAGFDDEAAMEILIGAPVLLMAAESNAYAATAATVLQQIAPDSAELRLYRGATGGAGVFAEAPQAVQQVVHWALRAAGAHRETE